MAQLVSVREVETSNGSVGLSLSEIAMSTESAKKTVANSNGPAFHTGENGINGTAQKPATLNGVENGASNVMITASNATPEAKSSTQSYDDPANGEYWTTKSDSTVRLRIGDTKATGRPPMTINQLLERNVQQVPNRIAMGVKREGLWRHWTYSEYYEEVRNAAKSFIKLGLEPYSAVGIIGFNSPEWFISDIGAIYAGGLACGFYTTNSPEACYYVASDAACNIIVVENKFQLDKILQVWDRLPNLKAIVQYIGPVEEKRDNVYDWNEFLEAGKAVTDDQLQSRIDLLQPNRCCTLIYTSGTTGNPKGVMLSHDNMTWIAQTSCAHVDAGEKGEEHVVSYLPLSHIAAQQTDIFMPLVCKGSVWFAQPDALKGSLIHTLKEARPTLILGVPRVWEKIMDKLLQLGAGVTGVKRKIANWAKSVALQGNQNIEQGRPVPFGWTLANSLVLKKLRVALGLDRCRLTFTGAAPVTIETLQYFQSINIPLYELYGMSECSGPHTVSKPGHLVAGSCGVTMLGCETKILNPDEDGCGEVCMRGRHVFMGYINNQEKTKESLDDEGWLHSGDIGKIDERDHLYITGRIKELIITAGGENVPPIPLEDGIMKELPVLSNIMVIGDKKKFLSCLVTLKVDVDETSGEPTDNLNSLALQFCKSIGCEAKTVSEVLSTKDEKLYKAIHDGINRSNENAPSRAQKVQKFHILERDFSTSGGELGPTLKLRRPIVAKMYKEIIDAFYD